MKYEVRLTSKFRHDLKRIKKRGLNTDKLNEIILKLANGESLPAKNKDHALTGNYTDFRECHIEPDWLLIYQYMNDILVLSLVRTGTHSDLLE